MDKFEWISTQQLDSFSTAIPHATRQELETTLELNANDIVTDSSAATFLMERTQTRKLASNRENQKEARFLIYQKFRSHGYDSPDEMMAAEPEMVAAMNGALLQHVNVDKNEAVKNAMRYSRAILDLKYQLVKDKDAKFTSGKIDGLNRKVIHVLVSSSNKLNPLLPKLKSETTGRQVNRHTGETYSSGNATVEITLL